MNRLILFVEKIYRMSGATYSICGPNEEDAIKMTETREGDIVISKEDFMQAFGLAYTHDEHAKKVLDSGLAETIVRVLFKEKR